MQSGAGDLKDLVIIALSLKKKTGAFQHQSAWHFHLLAVPSSDFVHHLLESISPSIASPVSVSISLHLLHYQFWKVLRRHLFPAPSGDILPSVSSLTSARPTICIPPHQHTYATLLLVCFSLEHDGLVPSGSLRCLHHRFLLPSLHVCFQLFQPLFHPHFWSSNFVKHDAVETLPLAGFVLHCRTSLTLLRCTRVDGTRNSHCHAQA